MRAVKRLMGIDQFGNRFDGIDARAPRRSLLEKMGARTAQPMFLDKSDGTSVRVGYVVSGGRGCAQHWVTLYEVTPFERPA